MSKSTTTLKTNTNRNTKGIGVKQAESNKDRNGIKKINASSENPSASSTTLLNSKSKPSVKLKEATTTLKKPSSKSDLDKSGTKENLKLESYRSTTTAKSSMKTNKTPITASKSSTISTTSRNSMTKPKRTTAPETPPSNRVTKTQYFPNKNLYSKVVKEQLKVKPDSEKINQNDNVTPSVIKRNTPNKKVESKEIKVAKTKIAKAAKQEPFIDIRVPNKNTNDEIDRPRTATLKRGSIVNSNIAGPDIPISDTPSLTSLDLSYEQELANKEDEYNYEDDFDSYESDFEEYHSSDSESLTSLSSGHNIPIDGETSTTSDDDDHDENSSLNFDTPKQSSSSTGMDEEKMLDSGNFDMPENKHKQLLDNIKESNEQDTLNRSNMASLSDEGFEDGKSLNNSGNMQFINFVDAQKKWKQNKNFEKRKKRGEEILNMIRLDHYNFTLIDMPSVPYDIFIKSYGKTNTIQVPTQTGDDDTCEEIQTDKIELENKWTQFPVVFTKIDVENPNYLELYRREFLGTGDDSDINVKSSKYDLINYKKLERFLLFSSQIIITLLNESHQNVLQQVHQNKVEIPFSSGYIKYQTKSYPFLKNRPITFVSCYSTNNVQILTIHGKNEATDGDVEDYLIFKSIICLWRTLNSQKPEKILVTTGDLCFCNFLQEFKDLIFGGLCDGSIAVWNINENNEIGVINNIRDYNLKEPIYVTGINYGHSSKVVSIQTLINNVDNLVHNSLGWKSSNDQICSLEENGNLIIWSVIEKTNKSDRQTTVPWNRISLVKDSVLSLKDFNPDLKDLLCTDMNINHLDPHHLYISTNYGYVVHCLATGAKANPKKFNPETISQANCLETCPFSPLYFFAGHNNGVIVLYSRLLEKPLMTMSNKDDNLQSGIQLLQWSHHRPCVFYAKDKSNTIHVWDLAFSDLYPVYSIPFKEEVTCMKLLSTSATNSPSSYMVIATQSGSIYLHVLNAEYGSSKLNNYQQDITRFLNYVSRL